MSLQQLERILEAAVDAVDTRRDLGLVSVRQARG